MAVDATKAPRGFVAAPAGADAMRPCAGCHFWQPIKPGAQPRHCGQPADMRVSCMPYKRADREAVIFVPAAGHPQGVPSNPQR